MVGSNIDPKGPIKQETRGKDRNGEAANQNEREKPPKTDLRTCINTNTKNEVKTPQKKKLTPREKPQYLIGIYPDQRNKHTQEINQKNAHNNKNNTPKTKATKKATKNQHCLCSKNTGKAQKKHGESAESQKNVFPNGKHTHNKPQKPERATGRQKSTTSQANVVPNSSPTQRTKIL